MIPEQEDEARWLAGGQELANHIDAALKAIMGRRVAFSLLIWPDPNKTLFAGTATDETMREGMQAALDSFHTMRTEVRRS